MMTRVARRPPRPAELIRLQRGMTQRAAAASAEMSESTLYNIEHGRRWPAPAAIVRLAGALGVSAEELAVALLRGWLIEHRPARPKASREPGQ
jgi:transcriptional regulator with XRE-family HTH domain